MTHIAIPAIQRVDKTLDGRLGVFDEHDQSPAR
jgi:hypothetical protein